MSIIKGFFESFAFGWIYGIENQIQKYGKTIVFTYIFANFGSVLFGCGFWYGLQNVWSGFVALFLFYAAFIVVTLFMLYKKKSADVSSGSSMGVMLYDLALGNVLSFKKKYESLAGTIPWLWCFLIKQFIPHVLLILFVNLAQSKTSDGRSQFGNYGGYVFLPYQVLGILTFVFAMVLFLAGVIFPDVYAALDTHEEVDAQEETKNQIFLWNHWKMLKLDLKSGVIQVTAVDNKRTRVFFIISTYRVLIKIYVEGIIIN